VGLVNSRISFSKRKEILWCHVDTLDLARIWIFCQCDRAEGSKKASMAAYFEQILREFCCVLSKNLVYVVEIVEPSKKGAPDRIRLRRLIFSLKK
jgi:hypothetical protein